MVEIPCGFWSEYAAEYLHKSGWSQSVGLPILPCFIAWNAQPVTEGSVIIIEYYYVTTQIIRQACIHSSVVARHERYKLPIQYSFQCNQVQTFFTFLNICQTNNSKSSFECNFCFLSSRTSFSGSGSTFSFSIAECFAPRWHATKNNCACIIDNWEKPLKHCSHARWSFICHIDVWAKMASFRTLDYLTKLTYIAYIQCMYLA